MMKGALLLGFILAPQCAGFAPPMIGRTRISAVRPARAASLARATMDEMRHQPIDTPTARRGTDLLQRIFKPLMQPLALVAVVMVLLTANPDDALAARSGSTGGRLGGRSQSYSSR